MNKEKSQAKFNKVVELAKGLNISINPGCSKCPQCQGTGYVGVTQFIDNEKYEDEKNNEESSQKGSEQENGKEEVK